MNSYTPLRCCACNRPLLAFAHSVMTRDGLKGWGPKCARQAFPAAVVTPTSPRSVRLFTARRKRENSAQGELFEVAA